MSEAAPRPWDWCWVGNTQAGHIYITDANGRKIAAIWGKAGEKEKTADLIIEAVNANERKKSEENSNV